MKAILKHYLANKRVAEFKANGVTLQKPILVVS